MDSWKTEFWELYDNLQIPGNTEKALKLKRDNIPRFLYRYRKLTSKENVANVCDEISTGRIYVASPVEFNDVYDSGSVLSSTNAKDYNSPSKELYEDSFRDLDPEVYQEIFADEDWYDKLTEFVAEDIMKQNPKTVGSVEEAKVLLNDVHMKGYEEVNGFISDLSNFGNRVACLTESNDNTVMWAHYADQHTGICLEYDTSAIENVFVLNRLFPVTYSEKLFDGIQFWLQNRDNKEKYFTFLDYMAVQKQINWQYEQEWRLILKIGDFYPRPKEVPWKENNRGRLYYFAKPSRVILGHKISADNEEKVRTICAEKDIPVTKATVTPYGLKCD